MIQIKTRQQRPTYSRSREYHEFHQVVKSARELKTQGRVGEDEFKAVLTIGATILVSIVIGKALARVFGNDGSSRR